MSSSAKISGKKRADSHEATDTGIEFFTPTYLPDDPAQIPFQEFTDTDLNNERWDVNTRTSTTGDIEKFQDEYSVLLPPSLQGFKWMPMEEIFPITDFVIKKDPISYPDLITSNKHLLRSQFMRSYISSIETLYYLSNVKGFAQEYESPNFARSFDKEKWRPWFHIYSNCRSGKGITHNPTVNKSGKYIVRLFWLGSWKKIYISDRLPVNASNKLLLPVLYYPEIIVDEDANASKLKLNKKDNPKKKVLEIWPFLLAKALMILASLTWSEENELVDFDIIQCLTGWISHKTDVDCTTPLDVWQVCLDHTFQYTWNTKEVDEEGLPRRSSPKGSIRSSNHSRKNLGSSTKLGTAKKSVLYLKSKEEPINKRRFVVVLNIQFSNDLLEGLIMSNVPWSHEFLVAETRNVPLQKPSSDEEFEAWKRFRWIDWAIENNLINPRCPPNPIRSFRTVDPFRYQYQHLLPLQTESATRNSESPLSNMKNIKLKEGSQSTEFKNITEWLDLEHIETFLKYIKIYYIPNIYKSRTRISNLSSENILKETKYPFAKSLVDLIGLQWKEVIRPQSIQSHRNEPVYIFCDCAYKQNVIINLNQTGDLRTITDRHVEKEIIPSATISECGLCTTTFLERVKKNLLKSKVEEIQDPLKKSILKIIPNIEHSFPKASIILSSFKWDSNRCDDFVTSMSTLGSGCLVLKLKPGRHTFTMWIKVEGSYVVQVISDSCLCVGTLEETLTLMGKDSLLFRNAYWTFVENFINLIHSFGTPDYIFDRNEFYKSFKPNCELSKKELIELQNAFFKEFFDTINDVLGQQSLRVVKILFRKWQFESSYRCDPNDVSQLCYPVDREDMKFVNIMQESAVKIQSFFRGIYERILLGHHNPNAKTYNKTAALLLNVGQAFNNNDRKLGAKVLRKFIYNSTIPDLQTKYSWYETMANDISTVQFLINRKITEDGWVFIARVFDNDTSEEVTAYANNVAVNAYPPNNEGYTVVAYGWAGAQPILSAKIIFGCQENIEDYILFSSKLPRKEIISDYYTPNSFEILCRYILDLQSDSTIITIHMSTDYPKVVIKLKVFNVATPENILIEVEGVGSVTIPSLFLQNVTATLPKVSVIDSEFEKRESTKSHKSKTKGSKGSDIESTLGEADVEKLSVANYFIIEASIEKNSWPLTANEWNNVEKEREKLEIGPPERHNSKKSGTSSTLPDGYPTKPNVKSSTAKRDGPKWTTELYYNNTDNVFVYKDSEKDNLLMQTKLSWYQLDPKRYDISQSLRVFKTPPERWGHYYSILFKHTNTFIELDFVEKFKAKFLTDEINKIRKFSEWFDGIRLDSEYMMEHAYKKRDRFIEYLKQRHGTSKKT